MEKAKKERKKKKMRKVEEEKSSKKKRVEKRERERGTGRLGCRWRGFDGFFVVCVVFCSIGVDARASVVELLE